MSKPSGASLAAATVLAAALLCLFPPASPAGVSKTVTFETPELSGSHTLAITNQYASEGLAFIPLEGSPNPHPFGSYKNGVQEPFAAPYLERNEADAYGGGKQVIASYEHIGIDSLGECIEAWSDFAGHLTAGATNELELYAGAESSGFDKSSGGTVYLDGYNTEGDLVAATSATVGAKDDTLLKLGSASDPDDISYFDLISPDEGDCATTPILSLDHVTFNVPTALPAKIILEQQPEAGAEGPVGSIGGEASLPIRVFRENGADEPVELHVSGLPKGVTLTGGNIIEKGRSTTTLTFAIGIEAEAGSAPFTISATSAGVSPAPGPIESHFEIDVPVYVFANSQSRTSATVTPCGTASVPITGRLGPGVMGAINLEVHATGDTSGLGYSLSQPYIQGGNSEPVELNLSEPGNSSVGSAELHIVGTVEGEPYGSIATVDVTRSPGTIYKVTSYGTGLLGQPETPQFGHGGASVQITGAGLCPGSTVEFGDGQAIAPASEFGPGGSSLSARIPRYAVTGTVVVHTPAAALDSPQPLQIDSFRNVWGWPYENGSTPKYLSYGLIEQIFGREEARWDNTEWPSIDARIFKGYASNLIGNGSCFGMAALIQYLSEESEDLFSISEALPFIPRTAQAPFYFDAASGPSPSLEETISIFHFDQYSAQFLEFAFEELEASHPPLYVIERLRADLPKSGERHESNLDFIMLENQGPEGGGHVVVPYEVEGDGSGGYYIDVYNPNRPYVSAETTESSGALHKSEVQQSRIHINSQGHWTFQDGFASQWEGGSSHIIVVPWGKLPVPEVVPMPPYASHTQSPEIPGLDTALSVFKKWVGTASSGGPAAVTQITDEAGRTLMSAGGVENENAATKLPKALLMYPASEGSKAVPPIAWLPDGGSYEIDETGRGTGDYSETLLGSPIDAVISSRAQAGVSDQIGVTPATNTVRFSPGATKPLTLDLIAAAGRGTTHTVELTSTAIKGSSQSLRLTNGVVSYSHVGGPVSIELKLSTASRTGAPVAISSGPILVGAGQQLTAAPASWGALGVLRLTISGQGKPRTLLVRDDSRLAAPVGRLSVALAGHRGLSRTVTIRAKILPLPSGAQLRYIWLVKQGSTVIARHVVTLSGASLRPGIRSRSFSFEVPKPGRFQITAEAALLVESGLIEQGSSTTKTLALTVH